MEREEFVFGVAPVAGVVLEVAFAHVLDGVAEDLEGVVGLGDGWRLDVELEAVAEDALEEEAIGGDRLGAFAQVNDTLQIAQRVGDFALVVAELGVVLDEDLQNGAVVRVEDAMVLAD